MTLTGQPVGILKADLLFPKQIRHLVHLEEVKYKEDRGCAKTSAFFFLFPPLISHFDL